MHDPEKLVLDLIGDGNRFSEKIMHEQNVRSDSDSIGMDQTLAVCRPVVIARGRCE